MSVGSATQVGTDCRPVGIGDVGAQTRRYLEIIQEAPERAGSGQHDVVRTRVILTDIDRWKDAIDVRKAYFADVRPVGTIMAVSRFVNPEWLVEYRSRRGDPEPARRLDMPRFRL